MKHDVDASTFWDKNGPLPSLSGAVLLVGATGRLSHAVIVFSAVLVTYVATTVALRLTATFIPEKYKGLIRVLVASTFSAVYARIAGMVWPILVSELSLYLGMIPLCLVSSGLLDRTEHQKRSTALKAVAYEASILLGLALILAIVREPFGYGTLSLPAAEGISVLFTHEKAAAYSLRTVSATAGGFLLIGCFLALYRKIRFRLLGDPSCGENDR